MKYLQLILLLAVISESSCTKEAVTPQAGTSLTVINAVTGSSFLLTNFSGTDSIAYQNAQQLYYGYYNPYMNVFGGYSGKVKLGLYEHADNVGHSSPVFNLELDIASNSIHSLFLSGSLSAPDTLFTTDIIPIHGDSVMGFRFVNLSHDMADVKVNVTPSNTAITTTEFTNINYKGLTAFKNYPAIAAIDSYYFEISDAANNVLASYTLNGINYGTGNYINQQNPYRFRNFTLALIGDATAGYQALLINNY